MNIHNLVQGTPEWHAHRANYFNASEAPAMLGVSKYTTRDQLIHSMATGLTKEVDASTQKIFDDGHKFEALARPIAEKIIGEDLYPVVGSMGEYSASFDGITMGEDIIFEHKTLNDDLRACFTDTGMIELPLMYRVQMEQQLMVSGAEKCLFMASKWDGEELVEENHFWYTQDIELRKRIVDGWNQLKADLADYVPPVKVEKVEAETIKALPVPSVVVRGEITASNLTEITPQFDAYLENINTELSTDQDFADAEANAKNCREMAKRIEALQENIIGQMVSVNEVNGVLENYKKAFNAIGLKLEKAVKDQKESLKTQAIMKAKISYADFVTELNKGIDIPLSHRLVCPDFATAIKGVKTLESMQSRINDALANGKAEATALANDVKTKVAYISESIKGYEHLFKIDAIVFSDIDYIKLHIQSIKDAEDVRRAKHEAAIKEQAEADARAKIEAEAKAKEAAEIKAREELEAKIKAEAKPIPDGDAIVNDTINQADFNNVFADAIKTGTGVMSVSVNEQNEVTAKHIPAVQVGSVRPTAQEIINLVAKTYNVDTATANRWLMQSFGELKAA